MKSTTHGDTIISQALVRCKYLIHFYRIHLATSVVYITESHCGCIGFRTIRITFCRLPLPLTDVTGAWGRDLGAGTRWDGELNFCMLPGCYGPVLCAQSVNQYVSWAHQKFQSQIGRESRVDPSPQFSPSSSSVSSSPFRFDSPLSSLDFPHFLRNCKSVRLRGGRKSSAGPRAGPPLTWLTPGWTLSGDRGQRWVVWGRRQ